MADRGNIDAKADKSEMGTSRARTAMAVVNDIARRLDRQLLDMLFDAAANVDKTACDEVIKMAISQGTRREDLADFYIPTIARKMGDQWCSDEMGFAEVTIGVSRLQSMLRDLGPDWAGDANATANAPAIMLVVLQDVYHTLGAMVLAGQLRRKGVSVRLMLGAHPQDVIEQLLRTSYNGVFISAARGETLESLRQMVDGIKSSSGQQIPIVVGGSILEVETVDRVKALTGADYATIFPDEALQFCGLKVNPQESSKRLRGT